MSLGESAARAVVTVSALTLPRALRERYREQWLADLRDAAEVGLNRAQIALAALAFAVTTSHPWPERRVLAAADIRRRSRVALGLVFGAVLLGLSQYASIIPARDQTGPPTGNAAVDSTISITTGLLIAYAIAAPILAVLIVSATRGVVRRERIAVWLLAVASCAPIIQIAVDTRISAYFDPYVSPGSIAYLVAAGMAAIAAGLLYRTHARPAVASRGGRLIAVAGGVVVIVAVAVGVALAATAWSRRVLPVWGDTVADGPARLSNPYYAQWLTSWARGDALVSSIFVWWATAGVVLGVLVALIGILGRLTLRRALVLTAGVLSVAVIADGGVLLYLDLAESGVVPQSIVQLLLVAARYAVVIATVAFVGLVSARPEHSRVAEVLESHELA